MDEKKYSEEDKRLLLSMAEECIRLSQRERPEVEWLKTVYTRFLKSHLLSGKMEADKLIYEKMYAKSPSKPSDILKIRYWRTGRHVPGNRKQCLDFGRALGLSDIEMKYLIQGYYDRCDEVFKRESNHSELYRRRLEIVDQLVAEYLVKVHPVRKNRMKLTGKTLEHYKRHLYYMDAKNYVNFKGYWDHVDERQHLASVNYGTELSRNLKLVGEIPRKTMLRHLIILGVPFINKDVMSDRLSGLGYLPLVDDHTLVSGERIDWIILKLLELYEERCAGQDSLTCVWWMQESCRILDAYFEKQGKDSFRFMYFKSLGGRIEEWKEHT